MQGLGGLLFFLGAGSFVLHYINMEFILVSWVDNFIRPLVIANATRIPFLLVLFGVLGGIAAFGLVGLFVGPVILAVFMAVWREWLHLKQVQVVSVIHTKKT